MASGSRAQVFDPLPDVAAERGARIADAIECLAAEADLQAQRNRLLEQADSLGFAAELADRGERTELLRRLESVKDRYADLGLDLLLRQEACRTLADAALLECDARIAALRDGARSRQAGAAGAAELRELFRVRDRLQAALGAPAVYEYPLLETSADDTRETLGLKLQYYQEVASILRALDERLAGRIGSARADFEALREAWRFVEDLAFTDMGDPSPGGDVLNQIQLPDGGTGSGGTSRPTSSRSLDRADVDLEFALGPSPSDPEGAAAWIEVLESRRAEVGRSLSAIEDEMAAIRSRLDRDAR